jgi:hypothetical protein
MHIGDLDGAGSQVDRQNWQATVTITVTGQDGSPVADATVSGAWSGGHTANASCTTGGDGTCSLVTDNIGRKDLTTVFAVSDVSHASLAYQPADNTDPDGDSDGTAIAVDRPW